jgi:D-beta-D-heptose 7-phosphate kinase / D-beta-D-heptose 1-phosphate adenosyltransferase
MSNTLVEMVRGLGKPRLLVIGDAILDRYIWGNAERVSQEAPVILLRADDDEVRLGGAANVANMVRGLEAEVTLAAVVGADRDGQTVREELERAGVDCSAVFTDRTRPTTVKERFIGRAQNRHPHQMLRVDREVRDPIPAALRDELFALVTSSLTDYQAVLVADYGKGVCTPGLIQDIIKAGRAAGVPVLVDPRPGQDFSHYHRATTVTPNRLETRLATGIDVKTPADALAAGKKLCDLLALDYAFVTLDSDGMALVRPDGTGEILPTRKRQVYDITGAGDMVLAMIGVGLASGLSPVDVGRLANVAGGLEVEKVGVVPVRRDEILADLIAHSRGVPRKVLPLDECVAAIARRRDAGQRIVFTNGCFDLLHFGHVSYLRQAAAEGDCLVVGLNSDASVRGLEKGSDRPLFCEELRAEMLAALEGVDFVVVFDDATPHRLLEAIRPDVLVKGGTYTEAEIVGREVVLSYGGTVKAMGAVPGLSTTQIVQRLRSGSTPIPAPHFLNTAVEPGRTTIQRKAG